MAKGLYSTAKKKIGENIKWIRRSQGLTQVQLADLSGVSLATIRNIEQGSVGYSTKMVKKISIALGISPTELLPKTQDTEENGLYILTKRNKSDTLKT